MEKYERINLFLDRDQAGMSIAEKALQWDKKYIDQSIKYKNHKDLNDFLIQQSHKQKQGLRLRKHA